MQVTGMPHGARQLEFAGFPVAEVLGLGAIEEEIKALIDRHGQIFIKVAAYKGGFGKKGTAGLLRQAEAKTSGVTSEAGVPAEHDVYFSITDRHTFVLQP
jgi:hypothetical protein